MSRKKKKVKSKKLAIHSIIQCRVRKILIFKSKENHFFSASTIIKIEKK